MPAEYLLHSPAEDTFRISTEGTTFLYRIHPGDIFGSQFYWKRAHDWEPDVRSLFAKYARRAPRVIDIGAHSGFYTVLACALNSKCEVMAFEPAPVAFQWLTDNVAINGFTARCRLFKTAISDLDGEMHFVVSEDPTMSHLAATGGMAVEVVRLDSVVPRDGKTTLIKIDIEGSEHLALLGMAETIRDSQPVIFFECNPGGPAEALEAIFRDHGYDMYGLVGGKPRKLDRLIPEEFAHTHHNFLATYDQ
ncbi:MAG: FkbM family methyltransferase [Acidobacteriaceae bacterium]|nr:FkbM family methyltransferase [Acidobacteriaceae bacterium]